MGPLCDLLASFLPTLAADSRRPWGERHLASFWSLAQIIPCLNLAKPKTQLNLEMCPDLGASDRARHD